MMIRSRIHRILWRCFKNKTGYMTVTLYRGLRPNSRQSLSVSGHHLRERSQAGMLFSFSENIEVMKLGDRAF